MGWVGSSVAASVLHSGVAAELLLSDVREGLAEGEAMDLQHGAALLRAARVRAVATEAMVETDAVVIAAGRGGGPDETRLDLLRSNAAITRAIGKALRGYRGLIVMVTNPVDVLTQVMTEASGLPPERVIGTGTLLDTARLRQRVGAELGLDPKSVHAQVVGEHGDSEVVLFSSAKVGGCPLRAWPGWDRARELTIAEQVRSAAYEIIRRKGATNHAIGVCTAQLLKWALRGERRVLTVARMQDGTAGLRDVCLSLPTVVGAGGATTLIEPQMDDGERTALHRSADVLRAAYRSLS